jgi:hypothetical protein
MVSIPPAARAAPVTVIRLPAIETVPTLEVV